jgi:hypothetical protein
VIDWAARARGGAALWVCRFGVVCAGCTVAPANPLYRRWQWGPPGRARRAVWEGGEEGGRKVPGRWVEGGYFVSERVGVAVAV